jgi:hypothetical protein
MIYFHAGVHALVTDLRMGRKFWPVWANDGGPTRTENDTESIGIQQGHWPRMEAGDDTAYKQPMKLTGVDDKSLRPIDRGPDPTYSWASHRDRFA